MIYTQKTAERIIWLFAQADVTNYRIHKETGVGQMTLARLRVGESKIENLPLATASKLEAYAIKLKEEIRMKNLKLEGFEKAIEEFNSWNGAAALYWNKKEGYVEVEVYHNDVAAVETVFADEIFVLHRKKETDSPLKNIGGKRKEFILDYAELITNGDTPAQAEYELMNRYPAAYF